MQNIIIALVLAFLTGMVFALIITTIHDRRRRRKIERINLPNYDPNNRINCGKAQPEDIIQTQYGTLYVLHKGA